MAFVSDALEKGMPPVDGEHSDEEVVVHIREGVLDNQFGPPPTPPRRSEFVPLHPSPEVEREVVLAPNENLPIVEQEIPAAEVPELQDEIVDNPPQAPADRHQSTQIDFNVIAAIGVALLVGIWFQRQ